jgi:hypothetical protein
MLEGVLGTVLRLDRFFSDERDLDPIREQSFVSWRNDFITTEHDRFTYATTVRASLRFPGLSRWWNDRIRLVVEGDAEEAPDALFPQERTTVAPPPRIVEDAAAELRYAFVNQLGFSVDAGVALLLRAPPGAGLRLRARYAQPFADVYLARFALTGFYRTDLQLGVTGSFDVQRGFGDRTVVRAGVSGTRNGAEHGLGFQWVNELRILHSLGPSSAVSVGVTSNGFTRPLPRLDTYRVYGRYRRAVLRRWFFVELEPGVGWPRGPDGSRERNLGFILRLEVQFSGEGRVTGGEPPPPSYEPDPDDPEPADPP